jgi:hypothetical protein
MKRIVSTIKTAETILMLLPDEDLITTSCRCCVPVNGYKLKELSAFIIKANA